MGQDASATAQHDWHCSTTLVTEELVIGAKQCIDTDLPIDLYTLRFRRRMDEGLGTLDEGAASFFHIRLSEMVYSQDDFFVAKTEYPVPHITPIPVLKWDFALERRWIFGKRVGGREWPALDQGEQTQLKLCRNRLSATDDELFWMTTFDDVGGHTCGLNTKDVGGRAIYEEGNTDRLFIVEIATDTRSGVNLHRFSDDETFPLSHKGWSLADAAVKHPTLNSLQILPGERLEATIYVVNAGAPSLPADTRLIAHLMGNTVDYNEEALLLDSPYGMPVPTRSEADMRIFELSAFPYGSYRIRWAMGPEVGQPDVESLLQNNVIFSP